MLRRRLPRRGAGHRADRSAGPRDAQRRFHVPDRPHPPPGDDPEPHSRGHRREARAAFPLPPRPRAAVRERRPARGRPGARPAVPQPEVEEGPEAGGADDRRRRGGAGLVPPLPGIQAATDFRAQTYKGRPVLTYWRGTSRQGIGVGEMVDARPVLSRDPPDPDAQRLPPGPARVRDHAQRHRDHHHLSGRAHRPAEGQGRPPRPRRRLGDPGDRPRHRARRVRVALARQDPADRDVLHAARRPARAVRLRAHELGQPRHRRGLPDVGPQHLDDLQDRPRDGQHPLAPRRQAEHLQAPGGGALRVAARRAAAQRRRDHAVRQRGVPAHPQVLARARTAARRAREDGLDRRRR